METVIVLVIVAAAVAWAGWRLFRRRPIGDTSCAAGCGGCSCASKPHPVLVEARRLARLRRT
jgi:hypothetical protein